MARIVVCLWRLACSESPRLMSEEVKRILRQCGCGGRGAGGLRWKGSCGEYDAMLEGFDGNASSWSSCCKCTTPEEGEVIIGKGGAMRKEGGDFYIKIYSNKAGLGMDKDKGLDWEVVKGCGGNV